MALRSFYDFICVLNVFYFRSRRRLDTEIEYFVTVALTQYATIGNEDDDGKKSVGGVLDRDEEKISRQCQQKQMKGKRFKRVGRLT